MPSKTGGPSNGGHYEKPENSAVGDGRFRFRDSWDRIRSRSLLGSIMKKFQEAHARWTMTDARRNTRLFLRAIREGLRLIRAGSTDPAEIPTDGEAFRAIRGTMAIAQWRKGSLKRIRKARSGETASEFLLGSMGFLAGHTGGDITGSIMRRMRDAGLSSRMDTLAIVLRSMFGLYRSPALEAWKRTGILG